MFSALRFPAGWGSDTSSMGDHQSAETNHAGLYSTPKMRSLDPDCFCPILNFVDCFTGSAECMCEMLPTAVGSLRAASMERILQENEALDSIIQRYLDSQSEVTQRTRDLYVIHLQSPFSTCYC